MFLKQRTKDFKCFGQCYISNSVVCLKTLKNIYCKDNAAAMKHICFYETFVSAHDSILVSHVRFLCLSLIGSKV